MAAWLGPAPAFARLLERATASSDDTARVINHSEARTPGAHLLPDRGGREQVDSRQKEVTLWSIVRLVAVEALSYRIHTGR